MNHDFGFHQGIGYNHAGIVNDKIVGGHYDMVNVFRLLDNAFAHLIAAD